MDQKHKTFREFRTPFPRSMNVRVPHAMAQFVLKREKLSHIIGTAPIRLEIARSSAYGLWPDFEVFLVSHFSLFAKKSAYKFLFFFA